MCEYFLTKKSKAIGVKQFAKRKTSKRPIEKLLEGQGIFQNRQTNIMGITSDS